jgi:hypothetical protein
MPNFGAPAEYLKGHYLPDDRLALVLIQRSTGAVKHEFRSARELADWKLQAHIRAANAGAADIYLSVNTLHPEATGRTKGDIDQIRHVYLDVDDGGREAVDKILQAEGMPKPHSILETSPGRHQILWQVDGFDKNQAENLVRDLAAKHAADQAVWDCSRVLRVPGFRNWKYENPHYIKVHDGGADRVYSPRDFPQYQIEYPLGAKFGSGRAPTELSTAGGSQSERDWAYCLRQLAKGTAPDVVERAIAEYRRSRGDKASPDQYAHRTVMKARAMLVSRAIAAPAPERESVRMSR